MSNGPNIPVLTVYKTQSEPVDKRWEVVDRWQEHAKQWGNALARRLFKDVADIANAAAAGVAGPSGPTGADGSSTAGALGPAGPPGSAAAVNMRIGQTVVDWVSTSSTPVPIGGSDAQGNILSRVQLVTTGWPVLMGFGPPGQPTPNVTYLTGSVPVGQAGFDLPGLFGAVNPIDPAPIPPIIQNLYVLVYVRVVNLTTGETFFITLANFASGFLNIVSLDFYQLQLSTLWRLPAGRWDFTLFGGILGAPSPPGAIMSAKRIAFYAMEL